MLVTQDLKPSLSIAVSFSQSSCTVFVKCWLLPKKFYTCYFFYNCVGLHKYVLNFYFVHYICLITPSILNGSLWNLHQCFTYAYFTSQTIFNFTLVSVKGLVTLHVGMCHNFYTKMSYMKLHTHKLHWYLSLREKFKENPWIEYSRRIKINYKDIIFMHVELQYLYSSTESVLFQRWRTWGDRVSYPSNLYSVRGSTLYFHVDIRIASVKFIMP